MSRLPPDEARALLARVFRACGAAEASAGSVASAMVEAERIGQSGHGLRRLPTYAAQLVAGKVDGRAVPVLTRPRPAAVAIDAGHGFAYPALDLAVETMPGVVRETGAAVCAIGRSHHAGALGLAAERLADAGCVSLILANTPAAIAPWGSGTPLYGTNPIAFATPVEGGLPLVVDLSLSKVARGKVMAARQRGERIPEGVALDRKGEATTDPAEALEGAMLPIGDAKGTALALAVEFLAAGLVGARFGWEAGSFFTADGSPPGTGQLLLVMDPEGFGGAAAGRARDLRDRVEALGGVRLPGGRREALRRRTDADGVRIDEDLEREMLAVERAGEVWRQLRDERLPPRRG